MKRTLTDLFTSFSEDIKNTILDLAIDFELPTDLNKDCSMDAKVTF
jgi:hypothetical protein